jgi:hypothetical protein
MTLASVTVINIIKNDGGFFDRLFHGTYLTINVFDLFNHGGYTITLAGLVVILVISLAAAAIAERLAGAKPGTNLITPVLITLLGSYIFTVYVTFPTEIIIEGVHLFAALLGAIVFGVFYVLLRKQSAPKKAAA